MSVTADLPDLNLWLALACPSIRTEAGESGGVTVLLDTNVLTEPMLERPDAWRCKRVRHLTVGSL